MQKWCNLLKTLGNVTLERNKQSLNLEVQVYYYQLSILVYTYGFLGCKLKNYTCHDVIHISSLQFF